MALLQSKDDCYDVIAVQGKGTFGEVVKAWKRGTGEMVAIKMLKNDFLRSRIIKNEIKLLKAIRAVDPEESHFIHFIEYFHDEAKFYLVFELLQQNLFEYQKKNGFAPVPVRHIRTITAQVLGALSKLKELSIIHADLKPENIMLIDQAKYPFKIKVIDFGSASMFNQVRYVKEPYIQSRFYRAPEILLGLPFCEKVDMWSLGCIIAELQLGCPLYPGNSEYDQIRYICDTQGMPKSHALCAASKSLLFFNRKIDSNKENQWRIKTLEEYQLETNVKPLEKRKFILKSLDQIESVNVPKSYYSDVEGLVEYDDLKNMVELIKRMLTLDSHERITPNAALKHTFISLQQLKLNYEHTKYYQLAQQCQYDGTRKADGYHYRTSSGSHHRLPSPNYYQDEAVKDTNDMAEIQRCIKQMENLHIAEPDKVVNLKPWSDGTYHPELAGYQDHAYLRASTRQNDYLHLEQRRNPVASQFGNYWTSKHSKVPLHSKSDASFSNPVGRNRDDATKCGDEERRIINSLDLSTQKFNTGEDHAPYKKPEAFTVEVLEPSVCPID
ncbi:homeodomain-interacting protein kinase 4 [Mixophyes fleayi]|uniref:homeodomain-interacting protein kinase 4 n=1 Tax=Mixophyes fleayi TaxID=3061075 RepID=UPI003F4E3E8A